MSIEASKQFQRLQLGLPPLAECGLFGLDLVPDDAAVVVLEVPWDATTSYKAGTSEAPDQVRKASHQLDLVDSDFGEIFLSGISYIKDDGKIKELNSKARGPAEKVIAGWEKGLDPVEQMTEDLALVNLCSKTVTEIVERKAFDQIKNDKFVGILGGDHSAPLGLIKALGNNYKNFSILHLDAHHDLREAYEGFEESHASIMFNVLQEVQSIDKLVAIGIRDYSIEESRLAKRDDRIVTYYDSDISRELFSGTSFDALCDDIISNLSKFVYISCDVDGLDPTLCPDTGTPVPGGLNWQQWTYLLKKLASSEKKIIGFDLCEIGKSCDGEEWNANVGARLLYKLCGASIKAGSLGEIR